MELVRVGSDLAPTRTNFVYLYRINRRQNQKNRIGKTTIIHKKSNIQPKKASMLSFFYYLCLIINL